MAFIELRAAAQQALEALEAGLDVDPIVAGETADALRAALAEPVQEPQGCDHCNHPMYAATRCRVCGRVTEPTTEHSSAVEPVQEPVAWRYKYADGFWRFSNGERVNGCDPVERQPLYTAPPQRPAEPVQEPQRKPLSVTDLQDALVYTCLIDRDAIEDPEGYDTGSTVAQIDALHEILTRKPT